ncbi:B12-binding domain-containing radical SAM protein [Azospirillum doebereinerae]|uniref:Radical SAM protein n=1 Tax=Azospirillum doebereinerae TaxID=92933 RepID=A0A433JD16_9PROT|nr:radical SAM protein [Azospirillum doebereinerae]RUQ74632.1 radical SAM protein [Azospirillum doebereinerae]
MTAPAAGRVDLVLVHPGGRKLVYQTLADDLTAVEPPLWCRLLAAYCRARGHSVVVIDSEADELDPPAVAARVAAFDPRLVALVVYGHQPSASTQSMPAAGAIARTVKTLSPDCPIILIGGHVAALPERTLREEAVDFAATGEGPVTLDALLQTLKSDRPFDAAEVPGIAHWHAAEDGSQEIRRSFPAPLVEDLDLDLGGDAWDLLPMEKYRAHNWQCFGAMDTRMPYASIYTTLGCPYKCSFCCINAPFGKNGYRFRSPEAVLAEIDLLIGRYGVRTFKIVDEMFVLNERHVTAICEGLIPRNAALGGTLNIWAYARVDTVKPGMLEMLRRAGIRWLALGIESGSKHVRDGAKKALRSEDIVGIVRAIQQAGINVIGNYIFGLPDDDLDSMRETLDLAKELNCEFANFYSAMAYPGSPFYDQAVEKGWDLPDGWSGYSQHSHDCKPLATQKLSAAEVLDFRDRAFIEYFTNPRYLKLVDQRFGGETSRHIRAMTRHTLRRKLLETDGGLQERTVGAV